MFKKKESTLDRRRKRIQDELQNLNKEMKSAGKVIRRRQTEEEPMQAPELVPARRVAPSAPPRPASGELPVRQDLGRPGVEAPRRPPSKESDKLYEDRFADYFMASSFDPSPTLRGERNVQRNRALIMVAMVAIMFIVLLIKFFYKRDPSVEKTSRENRTWPEPVTTMPVR